MKVLIPAYEPKERMLSLIQEIQKHSNMDILIVDDGSGEKYQSIFAKAEEMGCEVLHHFKNMGKGAALKTGFRYLVSISEKEGAVCADCDGQHAAEDILKVAQITKNVVNTAVLGSREFTGKVPLRSRFGNSVTRLVFSLSAGYKIGDTQTGLRGYTAEMFPWLLGIEGDRFEYEINVLLQLKPDGYSVLEIPIQTIYDGKNEGSHFRTFSDSYRVYKPFVKYNMPSLIFATLDFGLFLILAQTFQQLLPAVIISRMVSATFQYGCSNCLDFGQRRAKALQSAPIYFLLAGVVLLLNYTSLSFFIHLGIALVLAKAITEVSLFALSQVVQRKLIFVG